MKICDECETVAHCTKHGCIPKVSAKDSAMRLALEALEVATTPLAQDRQEVLRAITALREALAEQSAQQKPVAWMVDVDLANYQGQSEYRTILAWNAKPVWSGTHEINEVLKAVPLYTSPPARKPLTTVTIADAPSCLNTNDKAMWVLGWNECVETHNIKGGT